MTIFPFAGYWFYGAEGAEERASFFVTWGLLSRAPSPQPIYAELSFLFTSRPIAQYKERPIFLYELKPGNFAFKPRPDPIDFKPAPEFEMEQ